MLSSKENSMIKLIISGGQTGVDRAALDAAISQNIPHGGKCPKGRLAEDGPIDTIYHLVETDSADPAVRTVLNIKNSDATLIIVPSLPLKITDGTVLTIDTVKNLHKKHLIIDLSSEFSADDIVKWAIENDVTILNIAGPRESSTPGIYNESLALLKQVFSQAPSIKQRQKHRL
jgi:hypothetical protein